MTIERESGGWSFTYSGDQYVQASAGRPLTGWGIYWPAGVADGSTNPAGRYFNLGVVGSPLGRPLDRFGAAWAHTGWSNDFQALLSRLVKIDDQQSVELFTTTQSRRGSG